MLESTKLRVFLIGEAKDRSQESSQLSGLSVPLLKRGSLKQGSFEGEKRQF